MKLHLYPAAIALLLSLGCAALPHRDGERVNHIVVCWLKSPGDEAARRKLINTSESFRTIPGVLSVKAGAVIPSQRSIVDSSFDVAIALSFENTNTLAQYLVHPTHKNAVKETLLPLVRKIVVYDFLQE